MESKFRLSKSKEREEEHIFTLRIWIERERKMETLRQIRAKNSYSLLLSLLWITLLSSSISATSPLSQSDQVFFLLFSCSFFVFNEQFISLYD